MSTTGTPFVVVAAATERPPEPAPITQMSGVKTSATPPRDGSGERCGTLARVTRLEPLDQNGDERERAERRKRGKKLRRNDRADVEVDRAFGAAGGEAGTI